MLLAAGLSTRLGALGRTRPKPLLPLGDVPAIRFGLRLLRDAGIRDVTANLHHLGDLIRAELGDEVRYSAEPAILGTGGGVKRMAEASSADRFVVVNAKVAIDLDLGAVIDDHVRRGALATMVVREDKDARRWGAVDVAPDGRIRDLLGDGAHMFTGVHVFERSFVERIPDGPCDIVRTAYLDLVRAAGPVFADVLAKNAFFAENSTPERYLLANLALLDGTWPRWLPRAIDAAAEVHRDARIEDPVRIGAGARVGRGAFIARSVIGRNAVVAPGAEARDTVVWPGCVVSGSVCRAIVTPTATVPVP
jgi:NDP-sugar pyrophosphorylase family protein